MTRVLQDSDRPWLPLGGEGQNFMKIISVDDKQHQVVLVVKFGPHAVYPKHLHLAGAIAYTIDGQWEYEEGTLGKGAWALEPPGTEHLPIISEKGATILAILTSKDDQFVEVELPDGTVMKQDFAYFKRLYEMTPEEAARENASGIKMKTRT